MYSHLYVRKLSWTSQWFVMKHSVIVRRRARTEHLDSASFKMADTLVGNLQLYHNTIYQFVSLATIRSFLMLQCAVIQFQFTRLWRDCTVLILGLQQFINIIDNVDYKNKLTRHFKVYASFYSCKCSIVTAMQYMKSWGAESLLLSVVALFTKEQGLWLNLWAASS